MCAYILTMHCFNNPDAYCYGGIGRATELLWACGCAGEQGKTDALLQREAPITAGVQCLQCRTETVTHAKNTIAGRIMHL